MKAVRLAGAHGVRVDTINDPSIQDRPWPSLILGRTHAKAKESEADRGDAEAARAARKNVKKAQTGARQKRSRSPTSSKDTRSALGREGAKAAARKRGASKGTGTRRRRDDRHRARAGRPRGWASRAARRWARRS